MQEIWIPELLITLFLFLPIIRPFSKKLTPLEGLVRLPALGFLTAAALIPAYGWRPETLPLLLYAAFMTGAGIFRARGGDSGSGEARLFFAVPALILLFAAAGFAFFFTPEKDTALSVRGVFNLKAASAPSREYFIRVYTGESEIDSRRPLLVLVPPALGSLPAADGVCAELRNRGFTVVSYSRRGFDSPAVSADGESERRYRTGPAEWFRRVRAYFSGTVSVKANEFGRALEEERKRDILFLLDWIRQNPRLDERSALFDAASPGMTFLAGYDAGGSALLLLGNSLFPPEEGGSFLSGRRVPSGPVSRGGIRIRGIAAIESRLWSLYREETPEVPELLPEAGRFRRAARGVSRWFSGFRPKKISRAGEVPKLSAPVLFLVSDKSREPEYRESRYAPLVECFTAARGAALLASADGAGLFGYSDVPVKYPVLAALFSGSRKPARNRVEAPGNTAAVIAHFAAGVLGAEAGASLRETGLPAGVHIER